MDQNDLMLNAIWADQRDFNRNFFPPAEDNPEKFRQTKEFVLHMQSEIDELLRCTVWKLHRKVEKPFNPDQVKNEMTDILKYWISLALVWGISPEEMVKDYWRKSMVCRQRFSEEFLNRLDGSVVIVDIDGVLADYKTGLLSWIKTYYPELRGECDLIQNDDTAWVGYQSFNIDPQRWQEIKHEFRVSRGKLLLPVYDYAPRLLSEIKRQGHQIVLLTSRPIDKYPNIYTDTLEWLKLNKLPFDFIWWSNDKADEILSRGIKAQVAYAIEDDFKFTEKLAMAGIKTYFIDRRKEFPYDIPVLKNVCPVNETCFRNWKEFIEKETRDETQEKENQTV